MLTSMKLVDDAATLYIEIDNPNDTPATLNDVLENIQQWADQWLIKCSPSKTKLITCSLRKTNYQPIRFNNVMLESVKAISTWVLLFLVTQLGLFI